MNKFLLVQRSFVEMMLRQLLQVYEPHNCTTATIHAANNGKRRHRAKRNSRVMDDGRVTFCSMVFATSTSQTLFGYALLGEIDCYYLRKQVLSKCVLYETVREASLLNEHSMTSSKWRRFRLDKVRYLHTLYLTESVRIELKEYKSPTAIIVEITI